MTATKINSLATFVFALVFGTSFQIFAAGEIDPSFSASAYGTINGNVFVITTQPDGKILIGGQFTEANGRTASGISRVNTDGTADPSFTPPIFYSGSGLGTTVYAIAVQPDGKILVGGNILGAGDYSPGIRRLNSDGSLDPSFFIERLSPVTESVTIYDIGLQSDGKILIAGSFGFEFDTDKRYLRRLMPNGAYDPSFNLPVFFGVAIKDIDVLSDDKIIAGGGTSDNSTPFLRKFNADGTSDLGFTPVNGNGTVEAVKTLSDGKFLVGGRFSLLNGVTSGGVARVNSDGSIDVSFNTGNLGASGTVNDIAVRTDGRVVIGGEFTSYNTVSRQKIAQLNANGTLDTTFQNSTFPVGFVLVNDVEGLADGKMLAGVRFTTPVDFNSVIRMNIDGTTDGAFVLKATSTGVVQKILEQPDGKILVGGAFPFINGVQRKGLARLNSDGSLDASFVPYFNNNTVAPIIQAIALQIDGKILIGQATLSSFLITRMNVNGSVDATYSLVAASGTVNDIVVLPNGQILVAGSFVVAGGQKYIVRLDADGTFDASFAQFQPDGAVKKIVVQPDGKILIGGAFSNVSGNLRGKIARLNSDGSLDGSFNPPGGADAIVNDLDLQPDGKVVLGGDFTALNGNASIQRIGRLNGDGSLDTTFIHQINSSVLAVKLQSNGKMIVGGSFSAIDSIPKNGIARLDLSGSLDLAFSAFANTTVWDINLQADGKILVAGQFSQINATSAVRIGRLLNPAAQTRRSFDYDGDGKSDVSVFRPSTNRWYRFLSSNSTVSEATFGLSGDIIAPADFDGDGKTDIAIFRPSLGDWWYQSSLNSAQLSVHWGTSGDIPRPSDFDGDGKADLVVFRPSTSVWYRSGSTGAVSIVPFGSTGDKPLIGDFDGDGRGDVAIFRPSTGDWWWQSSVDNVQRATHWGTSTDVPAPADYDGDGKTDLAVYRPTTGTWYVLSSSTGLPTIINFGVAEDKPVPGDYDGDGKADIAVFRPSTGVWYLQRSSAGFSATQFGLSTDIPTEHAFVP